MTLWFMIYVCGFAGLIAVFALVLAHQGLPEKVAVGPLCTGITIFCAIWPLWAGFLLVTTPLLPLLKRVANMPLSSPPTSGIHEKDYAFTVEARNEKWDVYYFVKNGKKGTMAFTRRKKKFVIGLFAAGNLSEEEAKQALEQTSRTIRDSEFP